MSYLAFTNLTKITTTPLDDASINSPNYVQKGNSQSPQVQSSQFTSIQQKKGHFWALSSMGVAEIDDAKVAATARAIAKEKRICVNVI